MKPFAGTVDDSFFIDLGAAFDTLNFRVIPGPGSTGPIQIARGIEVSDETLSVDVIAEVVAGPGHFLGAAQTLELMQSEYVYPQQADRSSPDVWAEEGARDIWERAAARAKKCSSFSVAMHLVGMRSFRGC